MRESNRFFINTIPIIDYLIGGFANTSNTAYSIAAITAGWALWPCIRSPNESIWTISGRINPKVNKKIHFYMRLQHNWYLLLPWNGCCCRPRYRPRRCCCGSSSGCCGRRWWCVIPSCRCRSMRPRWPAAIGINAISIAIDYSRWIISWI